MNKFRQFPLTASPGHVIVTWEDGTPREVPEDTYVIDGTRSTPFPAAQAVTHPSFSAAYRVVATFTRDTTPPPHAAIDLEKLPAGVWFVCEITSTDEIKGDVTRWVQLIRRESAVSDEPPVSDFQVRSETTGAATTLPDAWRVTRVLDGGELA